MHLNSFRYFVEYFPFYTWDDDESICKGRGKDRKGSNLYFPYQSIYSLMHCHYIYIIIMLSFLEMALQWNCNEDNNMSDGGEEDWNVHKIVDTRLLFPQTGAKSNPSCSKHHHHPVYPDPLLLPHRRPFLTFILQQTYIYIYTNGYVSIHFMDEISRCRASCIIYGRCLINYPFRMKPPISHPPISLVVSWHPGHAIESIPCYVQSFSSLPSTI